MIDPAIIDALQSLNRPPPALMLDAGETAVSRTASLAAQMEPIVRQNERFVDGWAHDAQSSVSVLVENSRGHDFDPKSLDQVREIAGNIERQSSADVREYELQQKLARRAIKRLKARSRADGEVGERMFGRFLAATAKMGRTRFELGLALKALVAQYDPANQEGPIFDDPDALERYLLSADA